MRADIKQRWVESLRQEGRKQAKGWLHTIQDGEHAFCVLGVLCDVLHPDEWVLDERDHNGLRIGIMRGTLATLSRDIREESGLTIEQACLLSEKNDEGMSLAHLADYIEVNIPAD